MYGLERLNFVVAKLDHLMNSLTCSISQVGVKGKGASGGLVANGRPVLETRGWTGSLLNDSSCEILVPHTSSLKRIE